MRGFSLLEVMIGLLIVSLVFVFAYSSVNFSSAVGADMEDQTKVANVLESAAEKVYILRQDGNFASIVTGNAALTLTSADIPLMADFRNASLTITVSDYGGDASLKEVTISFTYQPASRKGMKTQVLKTLVSEPSA